MAHFDYPPGTPTGTVPSLYVVPSTDWAFVIAQLYKAANFDDGGTWAPGAFITVGGSGFQLTGTGHSLAASARLNVESTGEIRLKNGSLFKVDGNLGDIRLEVLTNVATLTVQASAVAQLAGTINLNGTAVFTAENGSETIYESGATATWESGSISTFEAGATVSIAANPTLSGDMTVSGTGSITLQSSANITGAVGSIVTLQGAANLYDLKLIGSAAWVQFNTTRSWSRAATRAVVQSYAGASTGPDDPDIWEEVSDASTAPCFRTRIATSSGGKSILEFVGLPIGGTITSVTVTTKGTGLPVSTTMPTYRIVSWEDTSAAGLTNHSSLTTDAGLVGTFNVVETQTTIAATGSPTVTAGRRYGLQVTHPFDASNQAMRIYECTMNGTAAEHKV